MLDARTLAAQLRQPHGEAALAVGESMNRSNGALNQAAIALLADVGQGRQRVAILGSMRELGAGSTQLKALPAGHVLASGASRLFA